MGLGVWLLAAVGMPQPPLSANARVRVMGTLFQKPLLWMPALPSADELPWSRLMRQNFSQKRVAALRYRVAQQRAEVERCSQQIKALEARLAASPAARFPTAAEAVAAREEVLKLRMAAGIAESRILRLKIKLGRDGAVRPGPLGAAARAIEIMIAAEERSARVLMAILAAHSDPWALLREDTESLLRMGTNATILKGYSRLFATRQQDAPRLLTHTAAIVARAAKLEKYAPGILLALDGHLELIEPHLDEVLDRFDEIEPFMPFVLENIDALAPHCGALLRHLDALLLYCDEEQRRAARRGGARSARGLRR